MSLFDRLQSHAETQADKAAIETDGGTISYYQLKLLVDQCVAYFHSVGLQAGDRVAILALNHPDWFIALFAAARSGVILVPMNWRLSVEELEYVITDSGPVLLLHDQEFADKAAVLNSRHPDLRLGEIACAHFPPESVSLDTVASNVSDPLLIVYTSGTTGRPKGAVLSEKALLCSAEMSRHMLGLETRDRVLNVLPLFHVGGLNIQPLPALLNGATLILPPKFEPQATVQALRDKQVTLITVVPTVLQALLASPVWNAAEFCSLRAMSIGSTDVPVALINAVQKDGIPVIQVYGATETSPVAIYQCLKDSHKVGSIGRAGSLCEIKLTGKTGEVVPVGESGEIQVKGDNILSGYWNNDSASVKSINDGWYKTADVAHQDADGYFWFDDRLKHVVISGGENIYPAELERVIREVQGVQELAVVGKPDERWGEVPVAVIVGNTDEQKVVKACSQLAKFKQPREVIFVESLPKNALGKVQVQKVKEQVF